MPWDANAPYFGFSSKEPWLPCDPRHQQSAVDIQTNSQTSTFASASALLDLRRSCPALSRGDIRIHETGDTVLEFERILGSEKVVCIFNLSGDSLKFSAREGLRVLATEEGPPLENTPVPARLMAWQGLWLKLEQQ